MPKTFNKINPRDSPIIFINAAVSISHLYVRMLTDANTVTQTDRDKEPCRHHTGMQASRSKDRDELLKM